ncbi:MAG: AAC(3) family N-acetyltransferase [Bacillota bacterium]
MSQADVVKNTVKPLTKTVIKNMFLDLGINARSKLEIHTKLSAFGYIVNKEYDIIDALIEIITEGVIITPAHTSEWSDPQAWENPPVPKSWITIINTHRKPFDKSVILPERIGRLPMAFLNYKGVKRTNHPTLSLAVYNKTEDTAWLDHDLDDRKLINPLKKLADEDGQILFLGTDFQTCTSIHLTEIYSDASYVEPFKTTRLNNQQDVEEVTVCTVEYADDAEDNFKAIEMLYKDKYIGTKYYKDIKIGNATCTLISAKKLYHLAESYHKSIVYETDQD